jgi:nucleoside-diphosphate-sugar epimerase
MSQFTIVGAGSIGSGVARSLAIAGHQVTVVTRHGSGPSLDGVTLVSADATDVRRLSELAAGSDALFNCANPRYDQWPRDWPPLADSLLQAAESSRATLVTMSNLYAYGVPSGPMTAHDELRATYEKAQVRAKMWRDAKSAHDAGRIHAVEVRASDFIGTSANSLFEARMVKRILAKKRCFVLGDPDATHSWSYGPDVVDTLVKVATEPSSWGRAWHVASNPPRSSREVVNDLARVAGVGPIKVSSLPTTLVRTAGLFNSLARELPKTLYQFEMPFVIDDTETREKLGLAATPWHDVLRATLSQVPNTVPAKAQVAHASR